MVKVLFFAHLRQQLGTDKIHLENFVGTITKLRDTLCTEHPQWLAYLGGDSIRVAVNQEVVDDTSLITAGDEVAFFPPVTGG